MNRFLRGKPEAGINRDQPSNEGLQNAGPRIFYVIGGLVLLAGIGYFYSVRSVIDYLLVGAMTTVVFFGVLGAIIVISGVLMERYPVSGERYPRAITWILGSTTFLLLLNAPVMGVVAGQLTTELMLAWMLVVGATGCAGGAVVGSLEARSIERAHATQRLKTEQEAAEYHAQQLEYLNQVLRHEVLNNVNIIQGYADLGIEESSMAIDDVLRVIHRQSEEMESVISDVRVLLESLRGTYTLERRNLSRVLVAELEGARLLADTDVDVSADIPEDIWVEADELLPRVFRNLFSNAIKRDDGSPTRIEVAVVECGDTVEVRVADNGPGISASEQVTLSELSRREDNFGLYLVQELLSRYDGNIEVVETSADGTEFKIDLSHARNATGPGEQS